MQWTEQDLLQLIAKKVEESWELEYKNAAALESSEKKKAEIGKDVSEFANWAGGTIIYGMDESRQPPHSAASLSAIDPALTSKEWLEQVINSRIQPHIPEITINPVELKETHPGKFAYVVVIGESTTAHQASDKRYYRRFNFESVAMEDYEVRQAMNRAARPAYSLNLTVSDESSKGGEKRFRFDATVQNESEIVGHDVSIALFVPRAFVQQPDDFSIEHEGVSYTRIVGNYVPHSRAILPAVETAPPLVPFPMRFMRTLVIKVDTFPSDGFTVLGKVFDQFGHALTAVFFVSRPDLTIRLSRKTHAAKRASNITL